MNKSGEGNNYYINPVLHGEYADPSVLRDGEDYYMTHSSYNYFPGLLIWHSRNLVNWQPVCRALENIEGHVWAPDLIKHKDTYYIYFPCGGTNWVITAPDIRGPWSEPVNLNIQLIDPGHICDVSTGKRYLHFSGGYMVELSEDGLTVISEVRHVYDGWQFPAEWDVEGFCLESPKLFYHNGYYYMTVAEGGTAGPPTSHMAVSARALTPWGPWENSPYNPVIHTNSNNERWWSKGHATIVDSPDEKWWAVFHSYEKGHYPHGRQTLLLPVEWTNDGWFKIPDNVNDEEGIIKPSGEVLANSMILSDDFNGNELGLQWSFYKHYKKPACTFTGNGLKLKAQGSDLSDGTIITCIPLNYDYEVEVEVEIESHSSTEAGLAIFYNNSYNCGIGVYKDQVLLFKNNNKCTLISGNAYKKMYLRIKNNQHIVTMYYSNDGYNWKKAEVSYEVSGMHHNILGEFLSMRIALYTIGDGSVIFRNFKYTILQSI